MSIIIDNWGREIDYLRISLTDRCNLRCIYCMPKDGIKCTPKEEILSLEEIYRISKIASEMGISKIRITGGEPLVRKGIEELIGKIKALTNIKEVCITTNGIYLEEKISELVRAGLDRVNISLDSMKEEIYRNITLNGDLEKVLTGIRLCLDAGLKVKLNTVILRGINDNEIMDFVRLTEEMPVDVRFIELMPIGEGKKFDSFKAEEVKGIILEKTVLIPCKKEKVQGGPAVYFKTEKGLGRVGFISAVTHNFCEECNRIRLTSQGFFKQCLFLNTGRNLKELIRGGASDEELRNVMEQVIKNKPQRHDKNQEILEKESRFMNEIGG